MPFEVRRTTASKVADGERTLYLEAKASEVLFETVRRGERHLVRFG